MDRLASWLNHKHTQFSKRYLLKGKTEFDWWDGPYATKKAALEDYRKFYHDDFEASFTIGRISYEYGLEKKK